MRNKILVLFAVLSCITLLSNAQDRHRLSSGEPYDIFISAKPFYALALSDFAKNYNNGFGANIAIEYQLQETNIAAGLELGYNMFLPNALKLNYLPTKYLFEAHQIPITIFGNYYFCNEDTYYQFIDRIKPYIGLGIGTIWGRYDYSLSNDANKEYYYLRDFEGQSGFRFGILPRIGIMIATPNHGFGLEVGYQYYFSSEKLENQTHLTIGFNYTYIID